MLKKITGINRVVVETLGVMALISVVYLITYGVSGNAKIALVITTLFSLFIASFFGFVTTVDGFDFIPLFVVTSAAASAVVAVTATVIGFAAITTLAIAISFTAFGIFVFVSDAKGRERKWWKILLVLIGEVVLLFVAFTVAVPYLAIVLLVVATIALGVMVLRKRGATM